MIRKKERSYSEHGTSIDQGIEVYQKGIVQTVPVSGRVLGIPCMIPNPFTLILTPLDQRTASALLTTGGYNVNLTLVKASDVQLSYGAHSTAVPLAAVGLRHRISAAGKLYTAVASMANTTAASNSLLASKSLWREEEAFGTNGKYYIRVNINNAASAAFKTGIMNFAYEVRGYEY